MRRISFPMITRIQRNHPHPPKRQICTNAHDSLERTDIASDQNRIMKHKIMLILVTILAMGLAYGAKAAETGWLGITFRIEAEGLFTPVIRSATVIRIAPDSPAATSAIRVSDRVLEVEGTPITDQPKRTIRGLMRKNVGQPLRLRLRHPTGEPFDVVLITSIRPN